MNTENGFTQAQVEAYQKVCEILHEHFDSSLIAVQANPDNDDGFEVKAFEYHGGMSTCIGLGEIAVLSLKTDAIQQYGRERESDE